MADWQQQREHILDDLRGLVAGDVLGDPIHLQLYASDASIYEIVPLAVVRPRSLGDVVACVQYAGEKQIPLHPRGAGTGLAGGALGAGIVLDFSCHLRRVLATHETTVRVQAGIAFERLASHLDQQKRFFPADPPTNPCSTIGGLLAVDASGSRSLGYGPLRQHVVKLRAVLADGSVIDAEQEPLGPSTQPGSGQSPPGGKQKLLSALANLAADADRRDEQPDALCGAGRPGYNLRGLLADGKLDLVQLLLGSEGTLALIVEATLRTLPEPPCRVTTLLLFSTLEAAARSVPAVLAADPLACDLADHRHVSLAREAEPRLQLLIPPACQAVLLVELAGRRFEDLRARIEQVVGQLQNGDSPLLGVRQAFQPQERAMLRQLARSVQPALYRLRGPARPIPVIEDIAVPPNRLVEFLPIMHGVFNKHEVTVSMLCHAGTGRFHLRPLVDLADKAQVSRSQHLAADLYEQVWRFGGHIGGNQGFGLSRTQFVRQQAGPLFPVAEQVKQLFDPQNIFNPGKVVRRSAEPELPSLRPTVADVDTLSAAAAQSKDRGLRRLIEVQLSWDPAQVVHDARQCHGCGECRTGNLPLRMCPLYRAAPSEEASPRAKANLVRGVLTGTLELAHMSRPEFKAVADLCIHCYMCLLECPAAVEIPKLMMESKGAYVAANGLTLSDWVLTRLDRLSALAGRFSTLSNWAIRNRLMRWLMEKTLGIAQGRKLPRVARRSFLYRAARRRLTTPSRRKGNKVAFFVDTYANYHDPQLAEALVAILEHNGVSVYVPEKQRQAGMAAISCGALDYARKLARHNVTIFAEAVRQGYEVVAVEPAVAVCLQREYPNLIDDEDARLVAAHALEACTYLWRMHRQGRLHLDFRPVHATLGYHMPCRLKALQVGSPGVNLLQLIPGLTVQQLHTGCSGMAGTFGLKAENYRTSVRAGWSLITQLRNPDIQAGTTECSTCKMQMEQGTSKPTIHPLKLLAYAYGLLPGGGDLLANTGEALVVT